MGDRRCPAVIDISVSPDQDGTPLRPIYCVKTKMNIKEIEKREDCFILDFDPDEDESFNIKNLKVSDDDSSDISVIAEKGQVACRDYPHLRQVCLKYPFKTTPHDQHCVLCYCYVCDEVAPCQFWTGQNAHCHAIDNETWNEMRIVMKGIRKINFQDSLL